MSKNIVQKVVFKDVSPREVYALYMDAKKHTKVTGAKAEITAKEGEAFSAHEGYITGTNVKLVKDTLVVQSWRAQDWKSTDPDSTLVLSLEQKGNNVVLHAIHTHVPDEHADGIEKGWYTFYWEPWKAYLDEKHKKKSK